MGLVAITPGAGFVPIWSALIIGGLVSPICYFMISVVKKKFGYDDALDAFGCHGVGGIWGGIATGIFARTDINPVASGTDFIWRYPFVCGTTDQYCSDNCHRDNRQESVSSWLN